MAKTCELSLCACLQYDGEINGRRDGERENEEAERRNWCYIAAAEIQEETKEAPETGDSACVGFARVINPFHKPADEHMQS